MIMHEHEHVGKDKCYQMQSHRNINNKKPSCH